MYPVTLNTNEVKNAAGTEIEFQRLSTSDRSLTFSKVGEIPSQPHRLKVSHQESGSGTSLRRRSLVRFDIVIPGQVDTTKLESIAAYAVVDAPVGNLTAFTTVTDLVANLVSNLASKGASTTILYDGTGYGAEALINGNL